MKKILLTGFEPFGGSKINPSLEAVKALNGKTLGGYSIVGEEIPLAFNKIKLTIETLIEKHEPVAVISVGQSGRDRISLERITINLADARIPYNCGTKPFDQILEPEGPVAYFSKLPIRKMLQKLQEAGIPAEISYSAGTYGCNQLFYHLMHYISTQGLNIPAGFVHVPSLPEQVINKRNIHSMCLDLIIFALENVINTVIEELKD